MKALLGGTFDPVHLGHLRIAAAGRELLGADAVTLVLSARPWHRPSPAASASHRWKMLRLAAGSAPGLAASDLEVNRPGPSYTVDTLRELRADAGADEPLVWLIGEDALSGVPSWRRREELAALCHLLVFARGESRPRLPEGFEPVAEPALLAARPAGAACVANVAEMPVSSTSIRRAIAAGRDAGALLPADVWAYIRKHDLYAGVGGAPGAGARRRGRPQGD